MFFVFVVPFGGDAGEPFVPLVKSAESFCDKFVNVEHQMRMRDPHYDPNSNGHAHEEFKPNVVGKMNNAEFFNFIIGFLLGALIAGIFVGIIVNKNWEKDAIKQGVGYYVIINTNKSDVEFKWKINH